MHVGENTDNHCTDDPGCFLFLCSDHDKIAREEKEDRAQNANTNSMVTSIGVDYEGSTCEEGNSSTKEVNLPIKFGEICIVGLSNGLLQRLLHNNVNGDVRVGCRWLSLLDTHVDKHFSDEERSTYCEPFPTGLRRL